MKFADDFGREDQDAVLVQIPREAKDANIMAFRPARVLSKAFKGHGVKPLTEAEKEKLARAGRGGGAARAALAAEVGNAGVRALEAHEARNAELTRANLDPHATGAFGAAGQGGYDDARNDDGGGLGLEIDVAKDGGISGASGGSGKRAGGERGGGAKRDREREERRKAAMQRRRRGGGGRGPAAKSGGGWASSGKDEGGGRGHGMRMRPAAVPAE